MKLPTTRKKDSSIALVSVFGSLALALNQLWCSLEGNSAGFQIPSASMASLINPRAFWLLGICLAALCFMAKPAIWKQCDHVLRFFVVPAAAAGTAFFAFSYHQAAWYNLPVAIAGLAGCGFAHFWFSSRIVLLAARTGSFSHVVWMLAAVPLIKIPLLNFCMELTPSVQVLIAISIPLAIALLFEESLRSATAAWGPAMRENPSSPRPRSVFGVAAQSRLIEIPHKTQNALTLLIVTCGVILASVRRLYFWGLWGSISTLSLKSLDGATEFIVVLACLACFSYLALIKTADLPLVVRFQPAIAVIIAGLFLAANHQSELTPVLSEVSGALVHADEALAYVLFWSVIAFSLDCLDLPSFRVIGIGGFTFGLASFLWVVAARYVDGIEGALVLLAIYVVVILSMLYMYRESILYLQEGKRAPLASTPLEERAAIGNTASSTVAPTAIGATTDPDTASPHLAESIFDRCEALAASYNLTPRESEVFVLLAQGRTRSYIQEELVLSSSTVKTHVGHIYTKLGVVNRQEMMDVILADN